TTAGRTSGAMVARDRFRPQRISGPIHPAHSEVSLMAVDMFLKIDGVEGESPDSSHGGEIQVLSWSWGESNSASVSFGGGQGTGKVNMQDMSFSAPMSKATPTLMLACAKG